MDINYCFWKIIFVLEWLNCGNVLSETPILSIFWNVPIDTPIGNEIASFRMDNCDSNHSVAIEMEKNFKSDSPTAESQYFIVQNNVKNNYYHMILLQKPLEDKFKVGDHLTLSITGICNITETKNDIFIQITEASSHSMKFAPLIQSEESEKQQLDSLLRGSLSRLIIRDFYNGAPPVKPYK